MRARGSLHGRRVRVPRRVSRERRGASVRQRCQNVPVRVRIAEGGLRQGSQIASLARDILRRLRRTIRRRGSQ